MADNCKCGKSKSKAKANPFAKKSGTAKNGGMNLKKKDLTSVLARAQMK